MFRSYSDPHNLRILTAGSSFLAVTSLISICCDVCDRICQMRQAQWLIAQPRCSYSSWGGAQQPWIITSLRLLLTRRVKNSGLWNQASGAEGTRNPSFVFLSWYQFFTVSWSTPQTLASVNWMHIVCILKLSCCAPLTELPGSQGQTRMCRFIL